jgi:hypothetical protein
MIVRVSGGQAHVDDQDDCTRLHVTTEQSAESTDSALRADGLGHLDDPATAQLSVARLREKASGAGVGSDWPDRWEAMIGYARGKGWLSPDGSLVQGHVESLREDQ